MSEGFHNKTKYWKKSENSHLWETSLHWRIHTGEKPYQCSQCDMVFTWNKYLTVHIRTHTGKNPYQFGQCDMAITKQANLTVHIRPHTG